MSTVSGPSYLVTLVDGKYNGHTIIEILGVKLEWLKLAYRAGIPCAKEGLIDTLKFTFNILLHYPKVRDWLSNDHKGSLIVISWWTPILSQGVMATEMSPIYGIQNWMGGFCPYLTALTPNLIVTIQFTCTVVADFRPSPYSIPFTYSCSINPCYPRFNNHTRQCFSQTNLVRSGHPQSRQS